MQRTISSLCVIITMACVYFWLVIFSRLRTSWQVLESRCAVERDHRNRSIMIEELYCPTVRLHNLPHKVQPQNMRRGFSQLRIFAAQFTQDGGGIACAIIAESKIYS